MYIENLNYDSISIYTFKKRKLNNLKIVLALLGSYKVMLFIEYSSHFTKSIYIKENN